MAKGLTERQQVILDFILEFTAKFGYPPTMREIGEKFNIRSTNGVNDHLVALEKKGYIRRKKGKYRAMELLVPLPSTIDEGDTKEIPLLGQVVAGMPVLSNENIEGYIKVDNDFWHGRADFVLKVKGESMKNAGIMEGDLAIIRKQQSAENGEIVIALVDSEATMKRYYADTRQVVLRPENESYDDIVITSKTPLQILGKVVGIIRMF